MEVVYLRVVGLLQLILVHLDLELVLRPHLHQRLRQLALKVLLEAVVHLHHAGLVASLGLPQFLASGHCFISLLSLTNLSFNSAHPPLICLPASNTVS